MKQSAQIRFTMLGAFVALLGWSHSALSQNAASTAERFRQMSKQSETKGLAEPFRGIATKAGVEKGLFGIKSTGVSTDATRKAAETFLAALTPEQRTKSMFPVNDDEWRKWMNQHFYVRQGVSFKEMTDTQRQKAFALVGAGLSAKGLKLTQNIMKLNETLAELTNDHEFLGEWLYHVTIMGTPSATEPWGWQLDGHHIIINYFVMGDQVVMSPLFAGSEPVKATTGKYKGIEILQEEQRGGLAMLRALSAEQRAQAVLNSNKTGNNNVGEAFSDNVVLDYAGVLVSQFNAAQKKQLLSLTALYIDNMDAGHAKVKLEEVSAHLDQTRFAWVGGSEDSSVFYYRIHSPVVLIEFDHQRPANLTAMAADPSEPQQSHIHVVVRTPNGNDYGKDLLRQHYLKHAH
jgi:hypothetical protein